MKWIKVAIGFRPLPIFNKDRLDVETIVDNE